MNSYKIYTLQFRDETGDFPVFNENVLKGYVTLWNNELEKFSIDKFPCEKFEFNKIDTQIIFYFLASFVLTFVDI